MRINEKYQIKSDTLNFMVMENKPVQDTNSENYGKENWVTVAYCVSLKSALKYLLDKEVFETELEDLETVMKAIEDFKADIDKLNI